MQDLIAACAGAGRFGHVVSGKCCEITAAHEGTCPFFDHRLRVSALSFKSPGR
jgi:hypothetical protein